MVIFASYRNEWDKLISRKKYLVFLIIGLFICLLWAGLGHLITGWVRNAGGAIFNLTPTPMGALPFFLQIMIPFLMFMALSDLLTVEAAENTMKAMISRPIQRWKLYASKILAVMSYAAVYLISVFALTVILSLLLGSSLRFNELLISLASYALTLIPLAVLACFAALIALLGKSGTLTMFILLTSYILLNVLPIVFPIFSEMLFTSYLSWYRLWIGVLPGAAKMIHMLLTVLAYGVAFFTAGSILFDYKEY